VDVEQCIPTLVREWGIQRFRPGVLGDTAAKENQCRDALRLCEYIVSSHVAIMAGPHENDPFRLQMVDYGHDIADHVAERVTFGQAALGHSLAPAIEEDEPEV
jgi:hypothetical protein